MASLGAFIPRLLRLSKTSRQRTFAHAVLNCQKSLLATGSYPNNNKGTELVILASKAAVNAVR
jgi:hypothetical protein